MTVLRLCSLESGSGEERKGWKEEGRVGVVRNEERIELSRSLLSLAGRSGDREAFLGHDEEEGREFAKRISRLLFFFRGRLSEGRKRSELERSSARV